MSAELYSFLQMGGYAFEVWTTWGATFIATIWLVWHEIRRARKIRSNLKRHLQRQSLSDDLAQELND